MDRINQQQGYTILETMIAIALFLVIVVTGMGALLNANLIHQKSGNMRSILDNLNFVMEDMSRNIRTGYNYHCFTGSDNLAVSATPKSCPTGSGNGWGIGFEYAYGDTTDNDDQWVYYVNSGKLWKSTNNGTTPFLQLTPDEIVLDGVASTFSVLGAEAAPNFQQPLVTIRLVGKITYKAGTPQEVISPFSIQTSVSQRLVDI